MDRIYNPDQVDDDRMFTDGDVALDVEATPLAEKFLNDVQEELCAAATMDGDALDPASRTQVRDAIGRRATHAGIQAGTYVSAIADGSTDAITAEFFPELTDLTPGMILQVRSLHANVLPNPTFTPNAALFSGRQIIKGTGQPLAPGDIPGNSHWIALRYKQDSDKWELLNPAAPSASSASCKVEVFTVSGTWIKPPGAKSIHLKMIGATGGGASGQVSPVGTAAKGGTGGAGGPSLEMDIDAQYLPDTCAVSVGVGGKGAGRSNGASYPGGHGAASYFFARSPAAYKVNGGEGGRDVGQNPPLGMFPGGLGGLGGNAGPGGISGGSTVAIGQGGGGGGAVSSAGAAFYGGGASYSVLYSAGGLATAGGAAGGADGISASTTSPWSGYLYPGIPGSGGGGNATGNGGNGGHAGGYGSGGGGGGAAIAPNLSGAGGDGTNGVVIVTTYF